MVYQYNSQNFTILQIQLSQQFKFVSLFHQTLLMFDPSQFIASGIAYTTTDSYSILGTWPALNSTLTYNAHQRLWFKNHLSAMSNGQQFEYSDLFTTIFGSYTIAISQNITNIHNQFAGVVFNLLDFTALKSNFDANYILVNSKGQIIIGQFNYPINTTTPAFFYNESITGFSESDWISIQTMLQNNNSRTASELSNCSLTFSQYLCRFNQLYQQETLIIVEKLQNPPYPPHIMIIFMNITKIYSEVDQLHNNITQLFTYQAALNTYILISISIAGIVIFLVILQKIMKPLDSLIQYSTLKQNTLKFINKQQQQDENIIKIFLQRNKLNSSNYQFSDNALQLLIFSYFCNLLIYLELHQLMEDQKGETSKSDQCLQIEMQEYPKLKFRFPKFRETNLRDCEFSFYDQSQITKQLYLLMKFNNQ